MSKDELIPSREFTLELIKKEKLPLHILHHSIKVAEKAIEIAKKIKKVNIDKNLIEIGALLHDIGRIKTHGLDHGIVGGFILKKKGFPVSVSRICETHVLAGLDEKDFKNLKGIKPQDTNPISIEEKIVCLADKFFKGIQEVTIEERFNQWFTKYGRTELLLKSKEKVQKIKNDLDKLL